MTSQPAIDARAQVLAAEEEWAEAVVRADVEAIDRIVSEDFMATNPFGETRYKEEFIANIRDGSPAYKYINREDPEVRIYGNVAVVTGNARTEGTYKGMDVSGPYRYTAIYVQDASRWRSVGIHFTRTLCV
ncbi:MAG TPA: nuclear transport factor 2 family protein [Blastocatellia bacterium]|nr:nuclear transport factor 2 family protein [Blastocatellia bacterium]